MGFSDYFGRFWFAAEPIFGVVMTLCFLGILRNEALYGYPLLLQQVIIAVLGASISCCIAWGIVDGIFYAWENHSLAGRKNLIAKYAKNPQQNVESLKMIEEDLQNSHVNLLGEDEKKFIYEKILANLAKTEAKEKIPLKNDFMTIFLDFCLNVGACLLILLPIVLFQNVFELPLLLDLAVIFAIGLMLVIGVWTETRKGLILKVKKGFTYAVLGVIITVLTYFLGG